MLDSDSARLVRVRQPREDRHVAYDEELAARVRAVLAARTEHHEQAMFGGLAFMVNTHMACGLMRQGLMVRVGPDDHAAALAEGAEEMRMGGRTMRGMVVVPADRLASDRVLERWVDAGVAYATSQPPKPPKTPTPPKPRKQPRARKPHSGG